MKCLTKTMAALAVAAFAGGMLVMAAGTAQAKTITIRIASGHPPAVVYAGLMKDYFEVELKKRVEARTEHKINFVEGYSGSIVKVYETFEGVRDGIVDIGGFCFCFEPSNLKLHAFQVMLPFGTMDPTVSLKIAQDVYKEVPYLTSVFEEKFNQKLLARIADGGYNLGTSFDWNKVSDLKGIKIAGAGLNLNWLKYAGVTPVQGSLPEAYTGLKTHIYEGWIMFPSAWVNLKLYEPGPFYTLIGFGSITWHGMTANMDFWNGLPKEVQDIMLEVASDFEQKTGSNNKERYGSDIEKLKGGLAKVKELGPDVRLEWAQSLKDWPQAYANELEAEGLPAKQVLNLALDSAEKHGYKWPIRYVVK
ncbi:MAG: C4-dicarboxylate TRAP transporter substrate-binding protein [Alphaproteobacteria bacterium]|nr:C4-dicarboxylate TRAP transporter substrate-binding protein [Alphaproteobacteria bacterium]